MDHSIYITIPLQKHKLYEIQAHLRAVSLEDNDYLKRMGVERLNKGQSILTKREQEIFNLLVRNMTTSEIAEELKISEKTVRNHISNVILKLNVKGRSQAIIELLKLGVIEL